MNIGELISAWEKDDSWVGKTPNPFIKKDVRILPNPCIPNEVVIYLSITDSTLFVDGKLEPLMRSMQFITFGQGNAELNTNGDTYRLKSELEQFTNSTIQEREEQIKEWEEKGMKIETSNPLMWKDFK